MSTSDLWGDLTGLETVTSPREVLEEQGAILAKKTHGKLRGDVRDLTQADTFIYALDIVAPGLNDYRYTVLTVRHGITMYPLLMLSGSDDAIPQARIKCDDEQELIDALSRVLGSSKTKRAIASLLAQMRAG